MYFEMKEKLSVQKYLQSLVLSFSKLKQKQKNVTCNTLSSGNLHSFSFISCIQVCTFFHAYWDMCTIRSACIIVHIWVISVRLFIGSKKFQHKGSQMEYMLKLNVFILLSVNLVELFPIPRAKEFNHLKYKIVCTVCALGNRVYRFHLGKKESLQK